MTLITNSNKHVMGLALAILGVALLSFDPIFIRYSGVSGADTAFLFGLYTALSMPVLLQWVDKRGIKKAVTDSGKPLLAISMLMVMSSSLFVISILNTTVANSLLIMSSMPVISAVFSYFILKEKLSKLTAITIALVTFGVSIIAINSLDTGNWFGDLCALLAVLFLSLNLVMLRKYQHVSKLAVVGLGGFLLALFMLPFVEPTNYAAETWIVMAVMGLFTAPIGRALAMTATKYINAAEISMIFLLETILATAWAYLFFQEVPPLNNVIGGVIILISLSFYTWKSFKQQSTAIGE